MNRYREGEYVADGVGVSEMHVVEEQAQEG